jgi:phosphoglycolate phosphatase
VSVGTVRLVVFDLDGTLVDSAGDLATGINRTLERLAPGTPPLSRETVRGFIGNGARRLVARSLAAAGLPASVDETLPLFVDSYRQCLVETTVLYAGAEEALDQLGDRILAVLTNKPGDLSRIILEQLEVARHFFRVYGGGDLPAAKPDPAGLLRLLTETGVAPGETLMVGDSAIDVRTGRAAGARTAGVTYGFDPAGLETEPPDLMVGDLRELARALGPLAR